MCSIHASLEAKHLDQKTNQTIKVNRDRVDNAQYKSEIDMHLQDVQKGDDIRTISDIATSVDTLFEVLNEAVLSQVPNTRRRKGKNSGPTRMSDDVKYARQLSKYSFWEWKCAGRPVDTQNELYINMKCNKNELRKACRIENAIRRDSYKSEILATRNSDTKKFHSLLRKHRGKLTNFISELNVDDVTYTSEHDMLAGWQVILVH